jgi:hypothetical protein
LKNISPIDRLVAATRLNVEARINWKLYETTVLRLKSIAEQFGLPLDVKVVYSSTRRVEHVTLAGETWLIYDQYIGQTMNMLNRLFIEASNAHPALVYFHKILAERLVEVGQLAGALHCASVYHSSRDVLSSKRSDEAWRDLLTRTHERFLLYHEFGHRVFASHTLMPVMREHVQFLIQHQIGVKKRSLQEVLDAFREAPSAAMHHQDFDASIREIKLQYESEEGQRFNQAQLVSLTQSQTEEEVFCDVFASDFVLAEGRLDGADIERVLRAIYVGFYHLQALEYLRRFPSLSSAPVNWQADNMPHIQSRGHCLRAHLIFLYQIELQVERHLDDDTVADKVRAFEIQLMEDQKHHYDVVFDSAMRLCDKLRADEWISELGEEAMRTLRHGLNSPESVTPQLPNDDDLRTAILIMTGWLP